MIDKAVFSSQHQFTMPRDIWFPDFSEATEAFARHFSKYPTPFLSMSYLPAYFRGEIDRTQLVSQFLHQQPPEKCLKKDLHVFQNIKSVCTAYRAQTISASEFDKLLMLAFRNRPTEDVFFPPPEERESAHALIAALEQKQKHLPVHFDCIPWKSYFTGKITRKEFADFYLAAGVLGHLSQLIDYGSEKDFAHKYSTELSVCSQLQTLCIAYKDNTSSPEQFDTKLLDLAEAFCKNIT